MSLTKFTKVLDSTVDWSWRFIAKIGTTACAFVSKSYFAIDHLQVMSERPGPELVVVKYHDTDAVTGIDDVTIADKVEDCSLSHFANTRLFGRTR